MRLLRCDRRVHHQLKTRREHDMNDNQDPSEGAARRRRQRAVEESNQQHRKQSRCTDPDEEQQPVMRKDRRDRDD